jgi:hypothetical protein
MVASYVYQFRNLLTDKVSIEIPMYGVYYSRRLSQPGDFTGTFMLDSTGYDNASVLDGTIPGKNYVLVVREGVVVGAYIIWQRTYNSAGKSMQLQGRSFESYASKRMIASDFTATAGQRAWMSNIWANSNTGGSIQEGFGSNSFIGVAQEQPYPTGETITRTLSVSFREFKYFQDLIDQLMQFDNSFDWYIDVKYNSAGAITKPIVTGTPLGRGPAETPIVFSYPGNITNYWFPESAASSCTHAWAYSSGSTNDGVFASAVSSAALAAGFIHVDETQSFQDITTQSDIQSAANQMLANDKMLSVIPTCEIKGDIEPTLGTYALGDYCRFVIQDPRFPTGFSSSYRIIGWNVNPPGSDGTEIVKPIFQGASDAGV